MNAIPRRDPAECSRFIVPKRWLNGPLNPTRSGGGSRKWPSVTLALGMRECQIEAITGLEKSFAEDRPRALIHMATGAGKTFTACAFTYRLIKYAKSPTLACVHFFRTHSPGERRTDCQSAILQTDCRHVALSFSRTHAQMPN